MSVFSGRRHATAPFLIGFVAVSFACGREPTRPQIQVGGRASLSSDPTNLYLHGSGATGNPAVLYVDAVSPTATTARYRDGGPVSLVGGNPWKAVGTWVAAPSVVGGAVTTLGGFNTWLGLKNSDDIGTRFDLRVEASRNGVVFASGEARCISGIARNPSLAMPVTVSFGSFSPVSFDGSTDTLLIAVLSRVGTDASDAFCGGHSNATGIRLYFDAMDRATALSATGAPTGPPPIPDTLVVPDDSTHTIVWAGGSEVVTYRRQFLVSFRTDATDSQRSAFFSRFGAVAVGGDALLRAYVVQVPDPGAEVPAFLALFDSISTAPGVDWALRLNRIEPDPTLSSRFPVDGAGYARAAWRSGSDTLWHLNAVRAPEAWGCENGEYGLGTPLRVGVFELAFAMHRDLAGVVNRTVPLTPAGGSGLSTVSQSKFASSLEHGRAITSVISAKANNGVGVSGLLWSSDVTVYTWYSANRLRTSPVDAFNRLRRDLRSHPVSLLNISLDAGGAAFRITSQERTAFDSIFSGMLADNPTMQIVYASGNDGHFWTPAALPDTAPIIAGALTRLTAANPALAARLIQVAATTRSGQVWPQSDWVSGQMRVAAPGENVVVLAGATPDATGAVPDTLRTVSGTSVSAPIVTGTLGLLRSFAPSLSPGELVDYLLRGAQRPRRDAATLATFVPAAPTLHGESVVVADAYGSLGLIANERLGTPVCGVEAELSDTALFLRRGDGAVKETAIPLAPNEFFGDFSVAQGGRRVSAWVTDATFNDVLREYTLANGVWSITDARPLDGRERFYAESDTIYVPFNGSTIYERHGADGAVETLDIATTGAYSGFIGSPFITRKAVSPDGRWVFLRAVGSASCAGGAFAARAMLMSLKPAAGPPVMLRDLCDAGPGVPGLAGWSASGKMLFGFGAAGRTLWTSTTTQGGWVEGATVAIGSQVLSALPTPDDVGLLGIEISGNACDRVLRGELNPTVFVALELGTQATCATSTYAFLRADSEEGAGGDDAALRLEYMTALRKRPQPAVRFGRLR